MRPTHTKRAQNSQLEPADIQHQWNPIFQAATRDDAPSLVTRKHKRPDELVSGDIVWPAVSYY